ncbi:uncharacterized protein LOC108960656 [Eucalyptus grandis]|uniref:uncharacterized protein LOC108960656 n=1 Tax=Eucalyptus grandis TaxID=71139 RepID=UPI00192E90EB|nr:uncharacterized protein LOC108960656 [Eucalyptus grandis]
MYADVQSPFNVLKIRDKKLDCPEELKEAVTSLIFAASRCGGLPVLQKICALFTAIVFLNNCRIAEELSTRRPSLESKLKLLREVAPTSEIPESFKEKAEAGEQQSRRAHNKPSIREYPEPEKVARTDSKELEWDKKLLERMKEKKYKDAEAAAQAA